MAHAEAPMCESLDHGGPGSLPQGPRYLRLQRATRMCRVRSE